MSHTESPESPKYTVLCVDDEQNILRAIRRALFSLNIDLLLAESAKQALTIMEQKQVHVIISDMKMPNMTGAELLEKVAEKYPDTFRVVLTGFADIEATIKAVNQGRIHRYMQKPWDNQELIATIEEGLERFKLKDENARLQILTQRQNAKLKQVNNDLEKTVQKRTQQIKTALQRIKKRTRSLEQVLFNVISINPDIDGKFAIEVSELTKTLSTKLGCSEEEIKLFSYASLIAELGLLGLKPENFRPPFSKLTYQQQKDYQSQTSLAKSMLAPAEHLQPVSEIIEFQFEHWNGSGQYHKVAKEIPLGARIHAIARDYWRLVSGRLMPLRLEPKEAKVELKKHRNTRYDGDILDLLLADENIDKPIFVENHLTSDKLTAGMVLANNLYNEKHMLLLPSGHIFSDATIAKVKQYEEENKRRFEIAIENENTEEMAWHIP